MRYNLPRIAMYQHLDIPRIYHQVTTLNHIQQDNSLMISIAALCARMTTTTPPKSLM
jgi:hypothetical protein